MEAAQICGERGIRVAPVDSNGTVMLTTEGLRSLHSTNNESHESPDEEEYL